MTDAINMALDNLRAQRNKIDAAITALEALGPLPGGITLAHVDAAITSAAARLDREADGEAAQRRRDLAPSRVAVSGERGVNRARFQQLQRRLITGPAMMRELRLVDAFAALTDGSRDGAIREALMWGKDRKLVGRTGLVWSLTDKGREWSATEVQQ